MVQDFLVSQNSRIFKRKIKLLWLLSTTLNKARCFSQNLNHFRTKLKRPDMDLTGCSPAKDATAANYENLCGLAGKHKCMTYSKYMLDHCSKLSFQSQNLLTLRSNQAKLHHHNSHSVSIAFLIHLST